MVVLIIVIILTILAGAAIVIIYSAKKSGSSAENAKETAAQVKPELAAAKKPEARLYLLRTVEEFIEHLARIEDDIAALRKKEISPEVVRALFRESIRIREVSRKADEFMKLDTLLTPNQRAYAMQVLERAKKIASEDAVKTVPRAELDAIAAEVRDEVNKYSRAWTKRK